MIDFHGAHGTGDFWFLRHGESAGNQAGAMMGRQDSPLTETGRRQARAAAAWLRGRLPVPGDAVPSSEPQAARSVARPPFARVFTSPLSRTRDTAAIVARELGGVPVEVWEELNELDIGLFTGLSSEQASLRHPAEWERFRAQSWEGVPGAERVEALLARAEALWARLLERQRAGEGPLLSVTHSGILQWIVKTTLGQREWMPLFPMGNCGASRFRLRNRPEGEPPGYHWEWALVNHPTLPDALPAPPPS